MGNKEAKMLQEANNNDMANKEKQEKESDNNSIKKSLPTSKDIILVDGYIRICCDNLLPSYYIFPLTICEYIYRYFQSKNILYWTSPQHIYSVSIEKDDTKERVNPLIKMDQCYCPAVTYKSNINIPIDVIDCNDNNKSYNLS